MPVSYANGSNTTLEEGQPENFMCIVQYKPRGLALYNIDVLVNLVRSLSKLALLPFGQIQDSFLNDDAGLRLRFTSTRAPGREKLATKEMMWAIRTISNFFHREKQGYGEVNFQARYEGSEPLGFAQLTGTAAASAKPPSGAASNVAVTKRADIDDEITNDTSVIQLPDSGAPGASNAGGEIVDLMVYRDGKTFDPYTVYTILMNLNVLAAENDDMEAPTGGMYGFDIPQDWQVGIQSLSPTSPSLSHRAIVQAIADLAIDIATVNPEEFRWRESAFKISDNGRVVGTGFIHHRDR